ncbi:3-(3-hydroxy-phenyl)propionate/3-hydroxycinnamic acid hydroxylase [Aspergillus udagawae]|nr:3-(3-hydroxy-phenyl)propionate/3-hydroxycinnamic acid hydroxylase [Aspergillus udagawae]
MSSPNSPFKAIIVGGGPIGLAAAHALHLADIDFVVLERRPAIFEDRGASLIVHPHTLRVLHQFGILDELLPRGDIYSRCHGHGPVAFHRAELIEIMYNGLPKPAKDKILTDKKLTSITTTQDGVTATCADGSVFHGSIVIGADGVYSRTRQVMRNLALKRELDSTVGPPTPIHGDIPASLPVIPFTFAGWPGRLARPTSDRTNYTEKEIDALAAEFAEFPLTKTVKVKDVWPRMLGAGLTNLDEGIAKHWSFGRIVLVGDACHKMTTHLGLGFNHGIQDVVVLCNSLRKALQAAPDRMGPDTEALTGLFEKYQAVRMSSVCSLEGDVLKSGLETRLHAWHNVWYYLLSWYLLALNVVENLFMRFVMAPEFRKGQVLDYVTREERMKGKISWIYPMSYQAKKED